MKCPYCNQEIPTAAAAAKYVVLYADRTADINQMRKYHTALIDLLDQFGNDADQIRRNAAYHAVTDSFNGNRGQRTKDGSKLYLERAACLEFRKRILEGAEKGESYALLEFEPRMDQEDLSCDIMFGPQQVLKIRRTCPQCWHILPEELFHYPIYRTLLCAPPECGKSSLVCALRCHYEKFNRKEVGKMHISWIQDRYADVDDDYAAFCEEAKKIADQRMYVGINKISYEPTPAVYIPPLFLLIEDKSSKQKMILAVYDSAGELYVRENHEYASLANAARIHSMDALWILLDAGKSMVRTALDDLAIEDSLAEAVRMLPENHVAAPYEQEQMEQPFASGEIRIGALIDKLLIRAEAEGGKGSAEFGRLDSRIRGQEILNDLQAKGGGNVRAEKLDLAVIVTKSDRLQRSSLIEDDDKPYFYDTGLSYFDEQELNRRVYRSDVLEGWIREWDLISLCQNFRSVAYHFVAARAEDAFRPIRIEEPFVAAAERALANRGR